MYFIYLICENLLPPHWGWHPPMPRNKRRRKEQGNKKMEKKKGETLYPNPGNGCTHKRLRTGVIKTESGAFMDFSIRKESRGVERR